MQARPLHGGSVPPIVRAMSEPKKDTDDVPLPPDEPAPAPVKEPPTPKPEPTRFGDWEINGRCIDF